MRYEVKTILEVGDRVVVDGTYLNGDAAVQGAGVIDSIDDNDPVWHYYVTFDDPNLADHSTGWFRPDSITPVKPLPTPPKFTSLAEADAWLEAHSGGPA